MPPSAPRLLSSKLHCSGIRLTFAFALSVLAPAQAVSQSLTPAPSPSAPNPGAPKNAVPGDVFKLNPFEVRTEADNSYGALNSNSLTQFDTALKNVPVSADIFTEDFIRGGILQLIEPFENDGTLVKRNRTEIERDVDHYTIIEHDGVIFACAALYPYAEAKTAEMAALTVSPQSQGQGDGEKILKRVEQRARAMGLDSIFVLTTRTMHWFIKRGFVQMDPDWLPEGRKRKYNWDRRSQVLVKKLS